MGGGKGGGGEQQVSSTGNSLPPYIDAALQRLTGRAENESYRPYATYGAPRIADFTSQERQAFDLANRTSQEYRPALQRSADLLNQGSTFSNNEFNNYMNPYTTGVVNRISDLGAENLHDKLLPQVNDTFTRSGQFGSTRHSDLTAQALQDTQREVLGKQAEELSRGYTTAMGAYQTGQAGQRDAGNAMNNLAQSTQTLGRNDVAGLAASGQAQRDMYQRNLDMAYGDFEKQRQEPWTQMANLQSILQGMPMPQLSTQTQYKSQPNPVTQLAALGAANQYAGQSYKRGGKVKRKKPIVVIKKSRKIKK